MINNSLIHPYVKEMLCDINPAWKKIILSENIKPILNKCFKKLDNYLINLGVTKNDIEKNGLETYIVPNPKNIFEAFKYFDPLETKVVIMGQDPYPNYGDACGLCFSTSIGIEIPKSLKVIYKCLMKSGYITKNNYPKDGNLFEWANQGVLMINRYLTRSPEIINKNGNIEIKSNGAKNNKFLHDFWAEFTKSITIYLIDMFSNTDKYIAFMLWGKAAQNSIELDNQSENIEILKWCHPVGVFNEANDEHFIYCDHFTKVNNELLKRGNNIINWNPSIKNNTKIENKKMIENNTKIEIEKIDIKIMNPIIIAIDGGCIGNSLTGKNKHKAKASYGVYFPITFNQKINGIYNKFPEKATTISGLVPKKLLKINMENLELIETDIDSEKATNNRGELLGLIYAFIEVIKYFRKTNEKHSVIIIEDSTYGLHMVNSRIWKYLKTDPELIKVEKNRDLVLIIKTLLIELSKTIESDNVNNIDFNKITNYNKIWDILIQPNGKTFEKNQLEQSLDWKGLTMLHQNSHLSNEKIDILSKKGGVEYEKYLYNHEADQLCSNELASK